MSREVTVRGVTLPPLSDPGANYVMWARSGNVLYVTGQLPKWDNERRFIGKVGAEFDIAQGQQAARLCALNVVTVVHAALDGNLDRVVRCLRVRVFVNGAPDFNQFSVVANGASDALIEVLGEAGRHTRTSVGASLPYGCAVEMDAEFEVRD